MSFIYIYIYICNRNRQLDNKKKILGNNTNSKYYRNMFQIALTNKIY